MLGKGGDKAKMVVKGKIKSVARINKMYTTLREESELLLKIKNMAPDGKLPRGLLLAGKPAIKNGKDFRKVNICSLSVETVQSSKGTRRRQREAPEEKVKGF